MAKFYIVGSNHWVQEDNFLKAITTLDELSGKETYTTVFEVEGDPDMLYDFVNWTPQIHGARFIARRDWASDKNEDGFIWEFPEELITIQLKEVA
jgi:hypothetical protein